MKLLKQLSVLLAAASVLLFSCEPDESNPCPDAIITVDIDSIAHTYTITAAGLEDIIYGWYVDDNLVETEELDSLRDNIFGFELQPGTYEICVKAESDICEGSIEICATVTIEEACLEPEFHTEAIDPFTFVFTADFEGIEETLYTWYVDGDSIETESMDTDRTHIFDYQFDEEGLHEVCIVATSECTDHQVSYCEEIAVGREDSDCPELHFGVDITDNGHLFTAEFDGMDSIAYTWYVNGNEVDKENFEGHDTDHKLLKALEPGTHVVCIAAEIDNCEEVEFCEEIVVEGHGCVEELHFTSTQEGEYTYLFEADFEGKEGVPYKWYINEDVVDKENYEGYDNDHLLRWTFGSGEYHVCIVSYQDNCESVEFCETLFFEEECPDLHFTATADGEFAYLFEADFEGKENTSYKWYINEDLVDKENYDGHDTDHELYWQFSPGEYSVCIVVETDRCEFVEFCETIIIEGDQTSCPELTFTYDQTGDSTYVFVADFPGIDTLEWYGWFVDGVLVDEEGTMNSGDNTLEYTFDDAGEHRVCIMTETPDCPAGVEYCKEIWVEHTSECVQMSYTAERDGTAPAYTFTADFEGRDNISYEWKVYVNDDYQGGEVRDAGSGDDHHFYWQFETGVTYEICLRPLDEACIDFQECKEFVID